MLLNMQLGAVGFGLHKMHSREQAARTANQLTTITSGAGFRMTQDRQAASAEVAPDDEGVALGDADGVLVDQVVEAGGDGAEVERRQALAQAVRPDLLQGGHDRRHVRAWRQKALHAEIVGRVANMAR